MQWSLFHVPYLLLSLSLSPFLPTSLLSFSHSFHPPILVPLSFNTLFTNTPLSSPSTLSHLSFYLISFVHQLIFSCSVSLMNLLAYLLPSISYLLIHPITFSLAPIPLSDSSTHVLWLSLSPSLSLKLTPVILSSPVSLSLSLS